MLYFIVSQRTIPKYTRQNRYGNEVVNTKIELLRMKIKISVHNVECSALYAVCTHPIPKKSHTKSHNIIHNNLRYSNIMQNPFAQSNIPFHVVCVCVRECVRSLAKMGFVNLYRVKK